VKQLAMGVSTHWPVVVSQAAVEQVEDAVQVTGFDPVHVPATHWSVCVHALPSEQAVPFGWKVSVGQTLVTPSQTSGKSHVSRAARQRAPGLPAAWAQEPERQLSVVHALPSSVHGVPSALS
jgi:hypothetical protein